MIPQASRLFLSLILATSIIVPLTVQAGMLAAFFGETAKAMMPAPILLNETSVIDMPLLSAQRNPNPQGALGGADIMVDEGALISTGPIGEDDVSSLSLSSGEISVYTVREGDSLSMIAKMFGVTSNTILWANELTSAKSIRAGDALVILPIPGVQYKIKRGDTLASLAKIYDGDAEEIKTFNQLTSNELQAGVTIIIPGGSLPAPVVKKAVPVTGSKSLAGTAAGGGGGGLSHPLPGSIRSQGIHGFNGIDFSSPAGTPIRAAAAGQVIVSKSGGWNGGYGDYVVIKHANGMQTLYAHNTSNAVGVGEYVAQGQVIGYVGSTGKSTGNHLHFEVRGAKNPF